MMDFAVDPSSVLNALATMVLVVDENNVIRDVNTPCEDLFQSSAPQMRGRRLLEFLPHDCPVFALLTQVRADGAGFSEHGVHLDTPRTGNRNVSLDVAPLMDRPGWAIVAVQEHSIALKIGEQLSHRHTTRSITAMAAMLAHEIKNPLSGIRGAAQLLEIGAGEDDKPLTRLICDEADRIVALVDRMAIFSDHSPLEARPVNIHQILEHVRRLAENGFGKGIKITETYDPSLPLVLGNRDQLIQIFLNLVKNAAEAVQENHVTGRGEVELSTAYRHGVRLTVQGSETKVDLPLMVAITDNGPGIPEDMRENLFDPFVTTKPRGKGLGLALVGKLVNDHGGIIEFESVPGRTAFRVMLPIARGNVEERD